MIPAAGRPYLTRWLRAARPEEMSYPAETMTGMSEGWTVERHLEDKPAWIAEAYEVGQGAHLDRPPVR